MIIVRPVRSGDEDALLELATSASSGLTTLPPDRDLLAQRVKWSEKSFAADVKEPGEEYYFLVIEDTDTGQIFGTSGIFATVGISRPFFSYKIVKAKQISRELNIEARADILVLSNEFTGQCEIGTLYLAPEFRHSGNGALLSRSRYLLMAAYPHRFAEIVMAEVRGWVDQDSRSPFWDAVGRKFFGLDLPDADRINALGNNRFIRELMPTHPIYLALLPADAQKVVGVPHEESAGAYRMLEKEGFRWRGAVDIFDAGPSVEAYREDINSVRKSRKLIIRDIKPLADAESHLIGASTLENFRALRAPLYHDRGGIADITPETAAALGLNSGDELIAVGEGRRL